MYLQNRVLECNAMVIKPMIIWSSIWSSMWFSMWFSMWSSMWFNMWPTNLTFLEAKKPDLHYYQTYYHYCHSCSKPLSSLTRHSYIEVLLLLLLLTISILKSLMSADQAAKLAHQLILLINTFLHPVIECKS